MSNPFDFDDKASVVDGIPRTDGGYIEFPLVDLSYYPNERLHERIRTILYGANPRESARWSRAKEEERIVSVHRPLANTRVEGKFLLFLPTHDRPWGMMEVSELKPKKKSEQDLTLALIPALALMPFRLYIESGNVWQQNDSLLGKFYAVDREGSSWSIHCH